MNNSPTANRARLAMAIIYAAALFTVLMDMFIWRP